LFVFDSFEGIPDNSESHEKNISGGRVRFSKGDYRGDLEEVIDNVRRFGDVGVCRFVKGFFDATMPQFNQPVAIAYLDVELASSTRTCLKYLWPLLVPGGILFSQDGDLPLVPQVFNDGDFRRQELKTSKPVIHGFGKSQLIRCRKEFEQRLDFSPANKCGAEPSSTNTMVSR
jgi:O-methyltransferase